MGTKVSTMLAPLWQGLPPVDPAAISGSVSWTLQPQYESVRGARQFTRETLQHWNMDELFDSVALVVSELVTNALRHAAPERDGAAGGRVHGAADDTSPRLHLIRWAGRLVCAVRDASDASPVEGEADFSAESGRGLYLVDSFSDSWGWHRLEDAAHGKVVWALFQLPQVPAQATAASRAQAS
ncbi:ATP-binding protein [Streptomyces ochraceiscleroticus]|uniref:ATP-binding protein n=1 Tax=Streptomyces ochraceiscleroticus TaxID=47761 RepID=A0ABW1MLQ4_9ACTN|nr:ATP-binding protein [Streptomyces ochraceiscleroticus]